MAMHEAQIGEHGGLSGIRDEGLLESALIRPENKLVYGGQAEDVFSLAAAYAYGIAKNHPFNDSNKRTCWVAARTFLRLNGRSMKFDRAEALEKVVGLASGDMSEDGFAAWLRGSGE